jgi:hypothetical protein
MPTEMDSEPFGGGVAIFSLDFYPAPFVHVFALFFKAPDQRPSLFGQRSKLSANLAPCHPPSDFLVSIYLGKHLPFQSQ